MNVIVPFTFAGPENESVVRTWSTFGLLSATPILSGTGTPIVVPFVVGIRRKTPGGTVIFLGSGPAVCLTSALALFLLIGINSGGKFVYVPIGPPVPFLPPMVEI